MSVEKSLENPLEKGLENPLEKGLQNIIESFQEFPPNLFEVQNYHIKNNIFNILILHFVEETISYNLT